MNPECEGTLCGACKRCVDIARMELEEMKKERDEARNYLPQYERRMQEVEAECERWQKKTLDVSGFFEDMYKARTEAQAEAKEWRGKYEKLLKILYDYRNFHGAQKGLRHAFRVNAIDEAIHMYHSGDGVQSGT